jgi:hypothetical protein
MGDIMDVFSLLQHTWIIGIVGAVIALLVMWRVIGGLLKGQALDKKLLQTGVAAPAQVLSVQATGASVSYGGHRQPQVAMAVQVHPQGGQPYQAQLVAYVSELQIPQVQPGAILQIRYDRNNPQVMAIEAFGGALPPGAQAPAGAAPMAGIQPMAAAIPMARPGFPKGALIGVAVGVLGAGVGIYVMLVNVGGFGLDTEAGTDGICGKAAACCEKVSEAAGNKGSADTCKNFKKIGVPEASCQMSYEQFKKTAETLKVTCE